MTGIWPETLKYAPILICTYNRQDKLRQVIESLQNNTLASESALFLFSDAPYRQDHAESIKKMRDYLHTISGFKHVIVIEREKNFGPLGNYIDAYDKLLEQYDRIIVLEDDIVTSPYFLKYMNDALEIYKNDPQIMAISAYRAPFPAQSSDDIYFMQNFKSWGNALWKTWYERAIEFDAAELLVKLKEKSLMRKFNYYSSIIIPNERHLIQTAKKNIYARDAVLRGNILYKNGYVIYPARSLTNHIGFEDGQHTSIGVADYITDLSTSPVNVTRLEVKEDPRLVKSLHQWIFKVHLKLLFKYLISGGPIRKFLKRMQKNKDF